MTREALAQWIGWLAAAAFFARLLPQPLKLWRTGLPQGVSALAALNNVVTDVGWLLYGVASSTTQVWLTASVALVPGIWTVVLLRSHTTTRQVALAGVWLGVVGITLPLGLVGGVLAVSVLVNHGPQVWTVLREDDLSGVAVTTWRLAILDATLWGLFGAIGDEVDGALVGYGVVLLLTAIVVLVRVAVSGGQSAGSQPAGSPEHVTYTPGP